jgi:hypothetical protein
MTLDASLVSKDNWGVRWRLPIGMKQHHIKHYSDTKRHSDG